MLIERSGRYIDVALHNQVNLSRLSNRESLIMVSHLLGKQALDKDLEELILEKTEGVPFSIEEFMRSLKNLKIIARKDRKYHLAKNIQDVMIPATIQDVIMARVDSLPEGAKEVLRTGSARNLHSESATPAIFRIILTSPKLFL